MKKPLIGINPYYFNYRDSFWNATREKYYKAIWLTGGIPVTVHHPSDDVFIEEIARTVDALVMVGGPDIPCDLYGGKNPELLDNDIMLPNRESFDRRLFQEVQLLNKPVLSICVGLQHINVIYGGSLHEDIKTLTDSSINHGEFNGDVTYHNVDLKKGSYIYSVLGKKTVRVASAHHQCIQKLGAGLSVSGVAPDGIIESVEDTKRPDSFLAVQWHPEIMSEDKDQLRLFQWVCEEGINRRT